MRLLAVVLALTLIGCAPKPTPPGPNPGAVKPGEGIPEAKLGQTRAEVEAALGKPESLEPNPFNQAVTFGLYHSKGVEIAYDNDVVGNVTLHRAKAPWQSYQGSTAEGIWVESNPEAIRAAYGNPPRELARALIYPARSLWFRLDREGHVESFSVIGE